MSYTQVETKSKRWRLSGIFRKENAMIWIFIAPTVIIVIGVSIYPLAYALRLMLYRWNLLEPMAVWFVGLQNFKDVFSDWLFWVSLKNTVIYLVSFVGLQFLIGIPLALLISKEFAGKRVVRTLFLIPMMLTPVVAGVIFRIMLKAYGGIVNSALEGLGLQGVNWLGDPFWAKISVIIVCVWSGTPFVMLVFLAGLQSLPKNPFEAAQIDGASKWQTFWHITVPLLTPLLVIAAIVATIVSLNVFDQVYVLTAGGPGTSTQPLGITTFNIAMRQFELGYASSFSFIMLIFAVGLSLAYSRVLHKREELTR